jgi:thiol-disulfide isomerase/thioredoxin
MKTLILTGLAALLLSSAALAGDELAVGQAAPTLTDVNWVKGEPVKEWKKGEIYVLDFWATWCGPCKKAIPHINELAKAHRADKVNVIGVAVWPRPNMVPTDQFVAEKGDGMDYLIAEDIEGQTAKRYMDGSLNDGIPTVMIVDRDGTLAWVGNPFVPAGAMDEAFKAIVAGTHDKAAFASADQARRDEARPAFARNERLGRFMPRIQAAAKSQDWPTALAAADELLAEDPADPTAIQVKYSLLRDSGDRQGASSFGQAQVKGALKDSAQELNGLAWMIVDPAKRVEASDRDLELALAAATRADELTQHANGSIIDTLARTYFWKGDLDKAIELQTHALEVASDEEKAQLQPALDEYLAKRPAKT